jgi:hypothetical protein
MQEIGLQSHKWTHLGLIKHIAGTTEKGMIRFDLINLGEMPWAGA